MNHSTKFQAHRLLDFFTAQCAGRFLVNESLSCHTWYGIGGPAAFFVFPQDTTELSRIIAECARTSTPWIILGEGANVLAGDNGFDGVIISLRNGWAHCAREGTQVTVGAGVPIRDLVYFCETNALSGVVGLSGIPGTVGGALTMNAGTDKGEIGDCVASVTILNTQGFLQTLNRSEISFAYRQAPELQNVPILSTTLNLQQGDSMLLGNMRRDLLRIRAQKQPLEYGSCGSVFKRPSGLYVGKMVEELGLKGLRYGDAMVSDKHGGFIVNLGSATCSDVLACIGHVREQVCRKYGVLLKPEVRLIGCCID